MLVKGTIEDGLDHVPKTGDTSFPWIWSLMSGLSILVLLVTYKDKKKSNEHKIS
jgi:hypothetical protein